MNKVDIQDIESVIDFWFKETTLEQKYKKNDAFDLRIKERFEKFYWKVLRGDTKTWRRTPVGRLAEVIILDQFARNMFRGSKQSFAGDELAFSLSQEALRIGVDEQLPQEQRQFFYMPYMHSESKEVHKETLKIFEEKSDKGGLEYEIKHKAIIDRFGRYPHRNKIMDRDSTSEELEFIKKHPGF